MATCPGGHCNGDPHVTYERARGVPGYVIYASGDPDISTLVQFDRDYPGVAASFGWCIRDVQVQQARYYGVACDHSGTDGTVQCPDCGLLPVTFITSAAAYLD